MEIDLDNLNVGLGLKLIPVSTPTPDGSVNVYTVRMNTRPPQLHGNNSLQRAITDKLVDPELDLLIVFQEGSPHLNGVNGATLEAYLGACAMRLKQFQANDMLRCDENQIALNKILEALQALHDRQTRISAQDDQADEDHDRTQAEEEERAERNGDHEYRD